MARLNIKVCGLTRVENMLEIATASPDLMGFIFYPRSPRFVGAHPDPELFSLVPGHIEKVAVMVDEEPEQMIRLAETHGITTLQLHGNESPGLCGILKARGLRVIKAVSADAIADAGTLEAYREETDLILVDTPTAAFGGSGRKFNWEALSGIPGDMDFFLSGGIDPEDCRALKEFSHPALVGVDINSRFEQLPGIKESRLVSEFINCLRNE